MKRKILEMKLKKLGWEFFVMEVIMTSG